jgi:hypothetical protein
MAQFRDRYRGAMLGKLAVDPEAPPAARAPVARYAQRAKRPVICPGDDPG